MYYSATSILPHHPSKNNNATLKFTNALIKKLAKNKIKKNTKKQTNRLKTFVKNTVSRRGGSVSTRRRNSPPKRPVNSVQWLLNRFAAMNNQNNYPVYTVGPLSSTNLYQMKRTPVRSLKAPSKRTQNRL